MPSITFMKRIWRIYLQKINVVIVKIILTFSVGILDDVLHVLPVDMKPLEHLVAVDRVAHNLVRERDVITVVDGVTVLTFE